MSSVPHVVNDFPRFPAPAPERSEGSATVAVDLFDSTTVGLHIAEVEFTDDETMAAFEPPLWCGQEITGGPDCRGSRLAELATRARDERRL